MAKPITPEDTHEFREHLRECVAPGETEYWTDASYDAFSAVDENDIEIWEYAPDDAETKDILELFESVANEFIIEEEGHNSFYVTRKT